MMKKVLYGVALTLFAGVSMGSLQSCKDDVNDLKTQTSYDLSKLRNDLNSEAARLKALIDANAANIATIQAEYAKISYVKQKCDELEAAYKAADQALKTELENQINGAVSTLNTRIDGIETSITDLKSELEGKIGANEAAINELKEIIPTLATKEELEEVYQKIEEVEQVMTQMLNLMNEQFEEVYNQLQQMMGQIEDAIKAITNQLDKQVTGILIQGVNSPVFGDFRTPLGVKSNILFNWYGYNKHNKAIEFPSNENEGFSATGAPNLPLADLYPNSIYTVPVGYYGDSFGTDVTLGKVYVTLNPVGANFDNLELTIEPSTGSDDALPYKVTLTPSDEMLYHGYSRSVENGFYEGEVKMPLTEENIKQIEVAMEDDLKAALKDAVKDPSKVTAKALVNAVFQQLQGKIPAYALRYDWTTGEVPSLTEENMDPGFSQNSWAVLSQYDLAVATALPLCYNTFDGVHGSAKLPEIPHIQNFINKIKELGNFTIDLGTFKVKGFTVNLGDIEFEEIDGKIKITIPHIAVLDPSGRPTGDYTAEADLDDSVNTDDFVDSLEEAIKNALGQASEDINVSVEEMVASINQQVNEMMAKINQQIGGKINDVIGGVENKLKPYYDKINTAIDLYNKIANKLNNFIENPNAYLQVAAFYNMGGADYGIVSGVASDPTPFYGNGEAFNLYLSSYTGELIVPACKKYVAVTKVVKGNDTRDIADINTALGENFNSVLDGNRIGISVPATALKSGNVYEFSYQALDYQGYTSTKKFYIEVK